MASTYPGTVDNLTNPTAVDPLSSPAHAGQHTNANDAIEAIETTLGVNPQGAYATVAARMAVVDSAAASAAVSASAAAVSASAALVSQLDAAQSSSDAQEWAIKLVDPVSGSDYSAKFNANLAATSASLAASLYDQFDDRFLGAKSVPPTVDNDGDPLVAGQLYFDTVYVAMKVYTGSAWIDAATSLYSWTGPVTIAASGSVTALRVTQTGTGDALLIEDSANPDATPFVVDASGNVGIGESSPSEKFQVSGNIKTTADVNSVMLVGRYSAGVPGSYIDAYSPSTYLAFQVQASERMRITSAGNVGLGVQAPTQTIHAYTAVTGGSPAASGSGNDPNATARFQMSSVALDVGTTAAGGAWLQSRQFNNYATNFPLLLNPNGGNVGVGTTTPGYKLDVNGTVNASAVFVNGAPVSAGGGAGLQDVFFLMGA